MPPRKKTKRAHSNSPLEDTAPLSSANTPGSSDSAEKPDEPEYDLISDPWTDEQETALLKAIIKWKPVGVHKHFRMLAISEYLRSQGYAPYNADHMRIPGIWKKLGSLYNLEALDEREDSVITDANEDDEEPSEMYCPFELPYDEYGDMMFEKRLALEGSSSPITSPHPESRRGSTVADTDEPRSSPAPSRGRKSDRGTRQAGRATRSTRLQVEIGTDSQGKASDEDMEDAESAEESAANDEEGEAEGEGEGEGDGEEEEEEDEEVKEKADHEAPGQRLQDPSKRTRKLRAQERAGPLVAADMR
ncbi:hypothetical protein N7509_007197 [Penicillium cosmopolitanum]|uniref:CT20 family protein n=1 Tax=Penicillium cosmopolitanum TaxID=1131564 RepID=A0A9W9VYF0_9EURO|nr:uncharacterized protein N7509_007197 [Penicillium cosmopolitanum]KAJ5391707.1 hypothetical protein N7509_007197 [Penicillium cosmopolitanum]